MADVNSIESLLNPDDSNEESTAGQFKKKQLEIKNKDIERQAKTKADKLGLPYISLFGFPISPEALALIQEQEAAELSAVCFFYDGKSIKLAATSPKPAVLRKLEDLKRQYFCEGTLYLVSDNSLKNALEIYKTIPKVKKYEDGVEITEEKFEQFKKEIADYQSLEEKLSKVNISDIVTLILATAIKVGASDVHIEAEEQGVAVRLRIDGVLQDAAKIDNERWEKIVARMKILARVKINIENKPQDGRYTIYLKDRKIDVRSSFLPTAYGESVVMRLLDSQTGTFDFENLGLRPEIMEKLQREIEKPNGMILTTGPTGSGKTTTLYAILSRLNRPGNKIITLEDPIEYQIEGINQSQVDSRSGYTFSQGLRSILRQDPNIIMIGEIRDLETAEISTQASLTGHLVLSTLHTNDASGVIPRLIEIGVKPYFLVPAINAVIGQRLVRQLCPACRKEHILNAEEEEQVKKILAVISPKANINIPDRLPTMYKAGDGCPACGQLGYKGRVGIFELFTMDDNIKQLTVDNAPSFKILQQAVENGMITMLQDGVLKAMEGKTSLEEVYRVIGDFDYVDDLYDIVISQTIGRGVKVSASQQEQIADLGKDISAIKDRFQDVPTQELTPLVMGLSIESRAGDVHIEPSEDSVSIRFRIDGVLHDIAKLPKTSYLPLLGAIKILSGFSTNVKRATMDGRFSIYYKGERADCRVSIITGAYGETVVIRVLSNSATSLDLPSLGISGPALNSLQTAMRKTRGIIITTGPTGSGKTTTLYGILNQLNRPDIKIITVEDPIEYQLPGIMQTQVDPERGYTFDSAMRSLLRQNPNIMMIGEIRDHETAQIAIEAAMTGHLVLSTIHANGAAGAISRLASLGLDKSALANAIEYSIGQRLARKLCPYCKKKDVLSPEVEERIRKALGEITSKDIKIPDQLDFYVGGGCEQCGGLGYKGRIGLFEYISVTPEIRKMIQQDANDYEIAAAAAQQGSISMFQDGILKALAGETSLAEVFRVID